MDKPKAYCRLLLPCFLLLSACTVDISQPDSSATAVNAEAKTWAVKFQHQSSFTEQSIGNDSNLLIVFYVQIMPDDFVMQLHR
ncbi:hypothetical protein EPS78_25540, partial [Escherichia coli]